ncbi:hypothetical protein K2173_014226 [Erythroxylum novogranatense]|uniref:Uncharacterized protein n=1 Tax=Erythroxylum novogranatense TaxID=1862640 RepID=A0AAV8SDL4_9ROSI|nr:hypothetical protein K2173_014226 [Erythroxylum novogranatense]
MDTQKVANVDNSQTNVWSYLVPKQEPSGTKTRAIFNDVFDKMVAAAQPIPGFRRVKGEKTPDQDLNANIGVDSFCCSSGIVNL